MIPLTPFLIIPVFIIIIAIAVFFALGVFRPTTLPSGTTYSKRPLLSFTELAFYHSLVVSAGTGRVTLTKVRIADLIQVKGYVQESDEWWKRFGPIAKKHVDFVICETESMAPLVLIELDDKSHLSQKTQQRDELVNKVFADAGYPLLRIPVGRQGYDTHALRKLIDQTVQSQTATVTRQ